MLVLYVCVGGLEMMVLGSSMCSSNLFIAVGVQ